MDRAGRFWVGAGACFLVALVIALPSFAFGPPWVDAARLNYVWTVQFAEGLQRGELYPRWLAGTWGGLGSPTFYFYPPLAFYLSGIGTALGLTAFHGIALTVFLAFLLSGLSFLVLCWFERLPPWWAVAYVVTPYHLVDWLVRAAQAELLAFVWLPILYLAVTRVRQAWGGPVLAVAYAGIILTHLPSALLASLFLVGPLILLRFADRWVCGWWLGIGLLLAAGYLVPALTLQGHVLLGDYMWSGSFQASSWTVWGQQDLRWLYPIFAAALVAGAIHWPKGVAVLGLVAMAMAVVPLLWELPLLRSVQFPWRLMAIAEFLAVLHLARVPRERFTSLAVIGLVGACALSWVYAASFNFKGYELTLPAAYFEQLPDAREYLPAGTALERVFSPDGVVDRRFVGAETLRAAAVEPVRWGGLGSLLGVVLLVGSVGVVAWRRRLGAARAMTRAPDGRAGRAGP